MGANNRSTTEILYNILNIYAKGINMSTNKYYVCYDENTKAKEQFYDLANSRR